MTRFYGVVGYGIPIENPPGSGVFVDDITEISYRGDVIRDTRKLEQGDGLNKDISLQNSISIIANAYAFQHFANIKYILWMGVAWSVTSVEVKPPRLILSLGDVYNGPTP